jgi:integrase
VPSEVRTLQWRQVDVEAGTVTLDAGMTKNGEPRTFVFTTLDELRKLLETQRATTDTVQRERQDRQLGIPPERKTDPRFPRRLETACTKAGCPGRIRHDFRRTAVRNLVRAGGADTIAMKMTGHPTRAVCSTATASHRNPIFATPPRG